MTPDIADIIAGELKVSRGTAYDMMREALAERYAGHNPLGGPAKVFDAMADAIRAGDEYHAVLRQYGFAEIAEPVQEPVAWMVDVDLANYQGQSEFRTILAWNAKPVWSGTHEINEVLKAVPLYTSPQAQPARAPLNVEQVKALTREAGYDKAVPHDLGNFINGIRHGEAAHSITAAPQPVPVKTYHDGKPWPVAPKPWVGLTADEMLEALTSVDPETKRLPVGFSRFACAIEAKLKEKNT
jgi:hypothetical protein